MQNKKLWISVVIGLMGFIGLIYWLIPTTENKANPPSQVLATSTTPANISAVIPSNANQKSFASISQQDTEINCQLQLNSSHRLIVNEQTRNCFEYFITQFGEKNLDQIKNDFSAYMVQTHTEPALSQILDLWSRYISYRTQLGNLQAPTGMTQDDPNYFRAIFNDTNNLRKKLFSDDEIEGLFGIEDTYHVYTINRMEVLGNPNLSETEKAKKLKDLFADLPKDWQENLEQLNKLEDLRKLTADIKARGGSAEDIRQMRLNLVGAEATQRLETLDAQRSDWKSKVTQYLTSREDIVKSNMSDSAKVASIQKLRQQHFNTPQEQIRVETFETIHDRGEKLPFAE